MVKSMKNKIIICVIAIAIIIIIGCVLKNPITYNRACNSYDSGDYITAAKQFDSLGDYKDAKDKYNKSMILVLKDQIDTLISDDFISEYKPVEYHIITDKCTRLIDNEYFSQLGRSYQKKITDYYEYVQFLNYAFNFDSSHEFLEIDCDSNPYFSDNLSSFYNNCYKKYEKQTWVASEKYDYFDEKVSTRIEVTTNAILKLRDEKKPCSDANIEGHVRVYVSYEGSRYDIFSESVVVPFGNLSNIQITTNESNLSTYYDTSNYKKEMGASNVAFVINFEKDMPTIKYAPDYIENQVIRTLTLKQQR